MTLKRSERLFWEKRRKHSVQNRTARHLSSWNYRLWYIPAECTMYLISLGKGSFWTVPSRDRCGRWRKLVSSVENKDDRFKREQSGESCPPAVWRIKWKYKTQYFLMVQIVEKCLRKYKYFKKYQIGLDVIRNYTKLVQLEIQLQIIWLDYLQN